MRLYIQQGEQFQWSRTAGAVPEEERRVLEIIAEVKRSGDDAMRRFTAEFDRVEGLRDAAFPLRVPKEVMAIAYAKLEPDVREALKAAADRIRTFHEAQWPEDFTLYGDDGEQMGMVWRSLSRVGVYAPGGRGAYPSTVLMDVIPAQVAGVKSIALASPAGSDGWPHQDVLAAAHMLGVDEVYRVGGAQAVAAFAYGTESILKVDKIVGPGNIYVALAKRAVMGDVGIDSVAGPSEVFIVADATAKPKYVAADMLAQAEHDPEAGAVCVSDDEALLEQVAVELEYQLETLPRRDIATAALQRWGALVHVASLDDAMRILNEAAPEHVELLTEDPERFLPSIDCAGAVFLGHYTPEPVGDYYAGTNHVLPTHGSAKYASGLSLYDFLRRISVVAYSQAALSNHAKHIATLARAESLEAHALSVLIRGEDD